MNTAIVSVVNAVLLRPLAVADPERLLLITRDGRAPFAYPVYRALAEDTRTVSGLVAALPLESDLEVSGRSELVVAEVVSANYGEVVGAVLVPAWRIISRSLEHSVLPPVVGLQSIRLRSDATGRV